jgi:hypothetical protein
VPRKPYSDRPAGVTNVWRMWRTRERTEAATIA